MNESFLLFFATLCLHPSFIFLHSVQFLAAQSHSLRKEGEMLQEIRMRIKERERMGPRSPCILLSYPSCYLSLFIHEWTYKNKITGHASVDITIFPLLSFLPRSTFSLSLSFYPPSGKDIPSLSKWTLKWTLCLLTFFTHAAANLGMMGPGE